MMTRCLPICWRISRRGACALACALVRELRPRRFEHSIAGPFEISSQEVPPPVPEETTVTADKPTTSVDDPGPSVAALETIVSLSKRRGSSSPARRSTAASTPYGTTGNSVWS